MTSIPKRLAEVMVPTAGEKAASLILAPPLQPPMPQAIPENDIEGPVPMAQEAVQGSLTATMATFQDVGISE